MSTSMSVGEFKAMFNAQYQCGSCNGIFQKPVDGNCPYCFSGNWAYGIIDESEPKTLKELYKEFLAKGLSEDNAYTEAFSIICQRDEDDESEGTSYE